MLKQHIIDKTLTNFFACWFYKIFSPNQNNSFLQKSKDNCLSIYKNLFKTNEAWFYNQNNMGEYYLIIMKMMKFGMKFLKEKLYNNKYEDLVNNKDSKTKK